MKKIISLFTVLVMLLSVLGITAFAAEPITVRVTIADENGKIALAYKEVTVTDTDSDNAITVNDALYAAHETYYEGGANVGYASQATSYGLSLMKLWGTAGLGYGYQLNNASCMSLLDTVSEGDYIAAYVYTDMDNWSDTYCYFDKAALNAAEGDTVELTLTANGYDSDWNPITIPVENAVITLIDADGNITETDTKTDAQGKAELKLEKSGSYIISAKSDTIILVPPVVLAEVTAKNSPSTPPTGTTPSTDSAPQEPETENNAPSSPKTSDNTPYMLFAAVILLASAIVFKGYNRFYEK